MRALAPREREKKVPTKPSAPRTVFRPEAGVHFELLFPSVLEQRFSEGAWDGHFLKLFRLRKPQSFAPQVEGSEHLKGFVRP